MVRIPGGEFTMGSNEHYPEEAPAHRVSMDGFWMDATAVTNAEFGAFVEETGYVTVAAATGPGRLSRRAPREPRPGLARIHADPGTRRSATHEPVVDVDAGRLLEASGGVELVARRP